MTWRNRVPCRLLLALFVALLAPSCGREFQFFLLPTAGMTLVGWACNIDGDWASGIMILGYILVCFSIIYAILRFCDSAILAASQPPNR
jgi:hypothetical protein